MASKYLRIAEYLEQKIVDGDLKLSEKLPSDEELMKQFEVSRIVVTNAMRILVSKGLVERIPGKGSFVAFDRSGKAKSPSEQAEGQRNAFLHVALILPCVQDDYAVSLTNELVLYGYRQGLLISVFFSFNDEQAENAILRHLIDAHCGGIILFPADRTLYGEELSEVLKRRIPLILLDHSLQGIECSCIQSDHIMGAKAAVSYLVEQGHRRISFFSDSPLCVSSIAARLDGYLSQVGQCHLKIDSSLIITDFRKRGGEQLACLIEQQAATAFVCGNSNDYEILRKYLSAAKKRIPEDFSVITFDKPSSSFEEPFQVTPTYIRQDVDKITQKAVELMKRMLQSGENGKEELAIPPKLVVGGSVKKLLS